jgi:ABC-2 type transport system ATP-binding protein
MSSACAEVSAADVGFSVRLDAVTKTFANQSRPALSALDAAFAPGRITGLVGPDGAGKTTLLRMIAGLLAPSAGSITIVNGDRALSGEQARTGLGYMPQRFGLYEDLTVAENLVLNADLRCVPQQQRAERFRRLLSFTDLQRFTDRLAGKLSGGMKQKLGLACSLIAQPDVLLLDEPSVGVDPISRRELWAMVRELSAGGMTVVWSTSYLDEAERCDDIVVMNEGCILYQGPPGPFTQRCADRTWLIRQESGKRQLLKQLARSEATVDAIVQGDSVRVVMKKPLDAHAISTVFSVAPEAVSTADSRLEDSFMDAIGGASKEESVIGRMMSTRGAKVDALPVIEARSLTKRFGAFVAADRIDFSVSQGEVFGLLGPNGAGKSTTFKMLCGLLKPTSGAARVVGIDLSKRASEGRQKLGYMAQKFSLYEALSVQQNLDFFGGAYGLRGAYLREQVGSMVAAFGLSPYLDQSPAAIPLGFKQRLALACALLHEPDILFLDEPTSGVDPVTRREFWNHINAMVEKRVTVLVTTHFMEEAEYCDRIALVNRGRIVALGTPDELKRRATCIGLPNPTMEDAFIKLVEETTP